MAKEILKEAFEWSVEKRLNGGGQPYYVIFIDPELSENTYEYRGQIGKFGGKWDNKRKTWYFPVSNDQQKRDEAIKLKVKPCIEFLKSVEKTSNNKTSDETLNNILAQIDKLINAAASTPSLTTEINTALDPKEIKDRLVQFKNELIAAFNNGDWKSKMMPIIKFRNAQGAKFSILNSILIWVQDPEATMVKSMSNWRKANRTIIPNAPAISLWYPLGKKLYNTKEEVKTATINYLVHLGMLKTFTPTDEEIEGAKANMTVGERERFNKYLNMIDPLSNVSFELRPLWFDIRYTKQIPNTEDLVGNPAADEEIPWYDGVSKETDKSKEMYDAILKVIQKSGVRIEYETEEQLDGARGVSKNGIIAVLKDSEKTPGSVSTLIHEFAHELLHQRFLKSKEEFSSYFVGTKQGRGKVEQQAEICAWIVMRNFGYNMSTAINYAGIWGADDKTCAKVFDTVAKVADYIIENMMNIMSGNQVNEGEGGFKPLTGFDVAQMLGPAAVKAYQRSVELNQIRESFNKTLKDLYR